MRPNSVKCFLLLAIFAVAGAALSGCETTGDPTKGGIFWSPAKAQQRLDKRQQTLNNIDADTSRVESSNEKKEEKLNQGQ